MQQEKKSEITEVKIKLEGKLVCSIIFQQGYLKVMMQVLIFLANSLQLYFFNFQWGHHWKYLINSKYLNVKNE